MVEISPSLQETNPPSLTVLLDAVRRAAMKELNCVKIGVVQKFTAGDARHAPTVDVKIAVQQVTSIAPDGTRTLAEYPLLLQVPVYFPGGGGVTLTFPVAVGDECLVLFHDRQIDNWLLSGAGQPPTVGRVHDLSDGIALVGMRSNPRALAGISTTSAQLRSDDGNTLIDFASGKIQIIADEVVIHGRNKTTFDAGGTGFVYTPSLIDTYTDGVTSNHHAPNPPEVPT